ncbi:adipor-like receptor, partial [Ceraceosorus guamensis]
DVLGFAIFGLAAVICFGFSAAFHTLHAHSCDVSKRANALDYIGIVVMIWGSFLPGLHYGFQCHPKLQAFYASMITVLSTFAGAVVLLPKFKTPAYRPWRTSVFILLGLSAVFPVAHAWALYGIEILARTMGIYWLIASGAMYIIGALLYTLRIPERFAPGKFDYIGASHQIFHVFILFAALAHYVCIRRAHSFWKVAASLSTSTTLEGVCRALEEL